MRILSSISSSELPYETDAASRSRRRQAMVAANTTVATLAAAQTAVRNSAFRWPVGGIYAAVFIVLIHMLVAYVWVPEPLADQSLRSKVLALTESQRPWLIVAGDSRAQVHVRPDILTSELGWPDGSIVNIGMPVCEPSAVLAACRELGDRFAPKPIVLLSVSFFAVNDGVQDDRFIRDESLWSMSWPQRFRMLPLSRALRSIFLPEQMLAQELTNGRHIPAGKVVASHGFVGKPHGDPERFSDQSLQRQMQEVTRCWFGTPRIHAVRWRNLAADLRKLQALGTQLVLFDSPVHPAFLQRIQGTPYGEAYEQFRSGLQSLGRSLGIPVLRYDGDALAGLEPYRAYYNLTHLSRDGAERFSERIAGDVADLICDGTLSPTVESLAYTEPRSAGPSW